MFYRQLKERFSLILHNIPRYHFEVQRSFDMEGKFEKLTYSHILSRGITPETHYGKSFLLFLPFDLFPSLTCHLEQLAVHLFFMSATYPAHLHLKFGYFLKNIIGFCSLIDEFGT